ncbi:MAG: hypothetical protein JNK07_03425 [Alphaproteobacteria bacterium]|nr:hypothetical protein [Alphaproteobacteria bacterium]
MTDTPANGTAKPSERRVRHGLIEDWRDAVGILALLLVAAFFGALIARFWPGGEESSTNNPAELAARLGAVEARVNQNKSGDLGALKERIAKLEARVRNTEIALTTGNAASSLAATAFGTTPGAPQIAPSNAKLVEDLGTRLAALEAKVGTSPEELKAAQASIGTLTTGQTDLGARIDGFAERLAKIENSDLLEMARRASLATAIANLSRAAQGSAPFKPEYDVVRGLAPNDAQVAEIAPLAAKGVPTASTLMTSFGDLAAQAMSAERIAASEDWLSHLWANFMSLISSRAVGEIGDDTNEGRLARAGVRLESGDLGAAVRELNAVTGAARGPLKPWLAQANARIKLEATLAELNTRAIEALSGPTTSAASEPVPQLPAP